MGSSDWKMEAFKGKYERISVENLDEFLKEMGVSFMLRKAAIASSPVVEISVSFDGVWSITTSTTVRTHRVTFKLGEEFEERTVDGRSVSVLVTMEDGKIISQQTAHKSGDKSTRTTRELDEAGNLVYTLTIRGVKDLVCVQKFKRI